MSLLSRGIYGSDPNFTNLFRLLDGFDAYSRESAAQDGTANNAATKGGEVANRHLPIKTFRPRFDVRETETAFELHGELPGIDRKDIAIEFTGEQELTVHGRVERSYTSGTPPASAASAAGGDADEGKGKGDENKEVAKKSDKQKATTTPSEKYWVTERSIGEFSRTFTFPVRVDEEAVSAGLNNGVLNITVPKEKKKKMETRRIAIN